MKEWAVFAIRNMCENNLANQEFIASLEAQGMARYPPEFEQMGLSIGLDGNRIKLQKK
jgi:membrane carboxypeptidase/penicillin-binding protein PbpC